MLRPGAKRKGKSPRFGTDGYPYLGGDYTAGDECAHTTILLQTFFNFRYSYGSYFEFS